MRAITFSQLQVGDLFEFDIKANPRSVYDACKNRSLRKFTKYQCAIPETGELFGVHPDELCQFISRD
jgi:hypothetical protein